MLIRPKLSLFKDKTKQGRSCIEEKAFIPTPIMSTC